MSQPSVIPTGVAIVTEVEAELSAMQPASMAPALDVVTPGTAPDVAAAPDAVDVAASSGVVMSTPEYWAMPPPDTTDEAGVHEYEPGSTAPATR
jgi:hypothetical protein